MNPISSDDGSSLSSETSVSAETYGGQVVLDAQIFLSKQLKYICMWDSDTSQYSLLYNPIHRQPFKQDYAGYNTNNTNMQTFIRNYCRSLVNGTGYDESYADFTCNCTVYNPTGSTQSDGSLIRNTTTEDFEQYKLNHIAKRLNLTDKNLVNYKQIDSGIRSDFVQSIPDNQFVCLVELVKNQEYFLIAMLGV